MKRLILIFFILIILLTNLNGQWEILNEGGEFRTIDFIIDGGKSKSRLSTTIVDCTTPMMKYLRIGEISEEEIEDYLSE